MPSPDDSKFLQAAQGETNLAKVMHKLGWNNATVLTFARRLRPDLLPPEPWKPLDAEARQVAERLAPDTPRRAAE